MPRELIATGPGVMAFRTYDEPTLESDQIRIRSLFAAPKHGTESHVFLGDSIIGERRFDTEYRIFFQSKRNTHA
jgi:hypothetical protein